MTSIKLLIVHSLVDTSLNMLGDAREGQRDEELHQLMFVLSDGICSNHEKMNRILRRAQEDKVLIVFVVLDSLKEDSNSILNMTQASYKMTEGRPQLSVERYMDTFPFPYYVVVRNIDNLPDILSSTLRQWAEALANSSA